MWPFSFLVEELIGNLKKDFGCSGIMKNVEFVSYFVLGTLIILPFEVEDLSVNIKMSYSFFK